MVKVFVAIINLYYIVVSKAARGQKQGQSMRNVLKWVVITLIAASTFLNYVDRQTLALLASAIQGDLLIDDAGYAYLVSAFLLAYSGGTIVSGWFVDRFGARVALPIFVAWWSLANALSGMMHNVDHMALTRFALGLAEVGNFIAAPILVRQFSQSVNVPLLLVFIQPQPCLARPFRRPLLRGLAPQAVGVRPLSSWVWWV